MSDPGGSLNVVTATVHTDLEAGQTIHWVVCSVCGPLDDAPSLVAAELERRDHAHRHAQERPNG